MIRRRGSLTSTSQKVTRKSTSRRSSTTIVTLPLPHQGKTTTKTRLQKIVNQNYSFDYSRIPYNSNAHLLSIPLGKPSHFDGEDYSFWSHKICSHLFYFHPSIWEIWKMECNLIVAIIPIGGLPLPKVLKNTTNYLLLAYY
jgi:hypothetical protein